MDTFLEEMNPFCHMQGVQGLLSQLKGLLLPYLEAPQWTRQTLGPIEGMAMCQSTSLRLSPVLNKLHHIKASAPATIISVCWTFDTIIGALGPIFR